MRSVTCVVFSLILLISTALTSLLFTLSLSNYTQQLKLENSTAIYLHKRVPSFHFTQLSDRIKVCYLDNEPRLSSIPIKMTNFTKTLAFDVSQDFYTHISDFQVFQRLRFRYLSCNCYQGECYDFEYLKFNLIYINYDMNINQQVSERVFTVPLNRKQNQEQYLEAVTHLDYYSRLYINYVNQQKEYFLMKCQLEIEVEQASYDMESGYNCRVFDQNQHNGMVQTPSWIKAETYLVTNVLMEVTSDKPLEYKLEGYKQQLIMTLTSILLFVISFVLYCKNGDNQLDLEDNM